MKLILALSSFLVFSLPALGDAVVTVDATKFGRIISLDISGVLLSSGCNGDSPATVPWTDILKVQFDSQCTSFPVHPNTAGLEKCDKKRLSGYKVEFKNIVPRFLATNLKLKVDKIYLLSAGDGASVSGPKGDVLSIEPADICPSSIPQQQEWPPSFCYESKKWAIAWTPTSVFSNQIYTHGSSIFIDTVGQQPSLALEDIRLAYQTALSIWAIAIQDNAKILGPEFTQYVESATSSSNKHTLFTPPQVIRMDCSENALTIVKWYAERKDAFPLSESDYVAKAQVQGRTVLLNANDNTFLVPPGGFRTLDPKMVNLVTVFVHEIGHSFGLPDRPRSGKASVMDPAYVVDHLNETLSPIQDDALALARVLKASITGSAPGVFSPEQCAGLRRKQ